MRELQESREAINTSREAARKKKLLVALDLNLTFMLTLAVKRGNLIIPIQKGTNMEAITYLSAANVSTQVVKSGIF